MSKVWYSLCILAARPVQNGKQGHTELGLAGTRTEKSTKAMVIVATGATTLSGHEGGVGIVTA